MGTKTKVVGALVIAISGSNGLASRKTSVIVNRANASDHQLNFDSVREALKPNEVGDDENVVVQYHQETGQVDLSTFDGHHVTVPFEQVWVASANSVHNGN